jgi:hypothetical protein
MQGKTFGPEQATSINTYKFMKVGAKKYKESGINTSIENATAKKRLVSCYELCYFIKSTIFSNMKYYMLFIMLQG